MLNAIRQLYLEGNSYFYCVRNNRFEIVELHLMDNRYCRALIGGEGEVFYALGGNWIVQNRYPEALAQVPQRDVMHIKLHVDQLRNPLRGESPLVSAYLDVSTGVSIRSQQTTFYQNQAKPGTVLSTDLLLTKDEASALRDRWTEQTSGVNVGGTPILSAGLKPMAMPNIPFRDAQLAEVLKMTDQDIAMAFRVPPPILGLESGTAGSAEAMMQQWISSGLGFCLNHVEEAFGQTFGLEGQPDEYVEFDTKALLRSAFKDRIDGLARAVQGGILAPNEARNSEDLPSVKFGDEPRVQQQVVPLSAAGKIPPAPAPPAAPPARPPEVTPDESKRRNAYAQIMLSRSRQIERQRLLRRAS
jgi:HK97 family phage portal protein